MYIRFFASNQKFTEWPRLRSATGEKIFIEGGGSAALPHSLPPLKS
jgi:hypothetical protein